MAKYLAGNDPFGGLESGDTQASGLQLATEGGQEDQLQKMVQEVRKAAAAEVPPPTTATTRPVPQLQEAELERQPLAEEPGQADMTVAINTGEVAVPVQTESAASIFYKAALGLLALLLGLFLFVVWRSGGKPDLTSWDTYARAFGLEKHQSAARNTNGVGLELLTSFRNRDGHEILLALGKIAAPQNGTVELLLSLVDRNGQKVFEKAFPPAVEFTPAEVYEMLSAEAVDQAYRQALASRPKMSGEKELPFMLLVFDHPASLDEFSVNVEVRPASDPWYGLGAPPATEKPSLEAPVLQPIKKPAPAAQGGVTRKIKGDVIRLAPPATGAAVK